MLRRASLSMTSRELLAPGFFVRSPQENDTAARQQLRVCKRIDGKESDDKPGLHIENAWTECASPAHAKRHFPDHAKLVDSVQMSKDQNLAVASERHRRARFAGQTIRR